MDVTQAIAQRRSVRSFRSDPAPESTVREILDLAARSPSGGNVQPWKVYALAGARLQGLVDEVAAKLPVNGLAGDGDLEYAVYPRDLWEPHSTYRFTVGEELYRTLGIAREDRAGRRRQFAENFRFFGAPVGLIFCIDRRMGPPQWADVGMFLQSVMLLAEERGLATCAQEAWSVWHKTVRRYCAVPDELIVFCGMALGYPDDDHPTAALRTSRADLDDFAVFDGFEA